MARSHPLIIGSAGTAYRDLREQADLSCRRALLNTYSSLARTAHP